MAISRSTGHIDDATHCQRVDCGRQSNDIACGRSKVREFRALALSRQPDLTPGPASLCVMPSARLTATSKSAILSDNGPRAQSVDMPFPSTPAIFSIKAELCGGRGSSTNGAGHQYHTLRRRLDRCISGVSEGGITVPPSALAWPTWYIFSATHLDRREICPRVRGNVPSATGSGRPGTPTRPASAIKTRRFALQRRPYADFVEEGR